MYSALFRDKPSPYTDLGAVDVLVSALFRNKPSLYTDLGAVDVLIFALFRDKPSQYTLPRCCICSRICIVS